MAAVKEALNKREEKSVSTESILTLAECVLKNNIFEHNGKFFKQKQGTAIGTKMAPSYAILFMGDLEEKILDRGECKPSIWWRYIDDIFCIWEHGEDKLKEFLDYLNSCHPSIKFTAEYSRDKVNFLDVQVIRKDNKLITDLYVKPTDTHQYLDASSCHVYHSKKSIPFSQALRLNRICSEPSFFDKRCNQLESWLKERGYSDKLIRQQVLKARQFPREGLLYKENNNIKKDTLTFNITYHPAFAKIKNILNNIHLLLTPDAEHRKVFSTVPIVGFKKGKSLKEFLVRAKVAPLLDNSVKGSKGCGKRRCDVCNFLENTNIFSDKNKENTYNIRSDLNCDSNNVVYLVNCKQCKIQYVGSTSTKFRTRFNNYKSAHKRYLSNKKINQINFHSHYEQKGHSGISDWMVTLIDKAEDVNSLRRKEMFWQYKLNTFAPFGLNECEVSINVT